MLCRGKLCATPRQEPVAGEERDWESKSLLTIKRNFIEFIASGRASPALADKITPQSPHTANHS